MDLKINKWKHGYDPLSKYNLIYTCNFLFLNDEDQD